MCRESRGQGPLAPSFQTFSQENHVSIRAGLWACQLTRQSRQLMSQKDWYQSSGGSQKDRYCKIVVEAIPGLGCLIYLFI